MASVRTPCAVCKFLRRKCASDCIFAPLFAPNQTEKFIHLHKMYGTSNVQKLLAELPVDQRQDAVNSLAYEAEARCRDPVYGCVGPIVFLQHRVKNLKGVLQDAYKELAAYQDAVQQTQQAMGVAGFPDAQPMPDMMNPLGVNPLSASLSSEPYKMASMMGIPTMGSSLEIREPGPQSNNNNIFHPEQLFMPTGTVGREEQLEINRAFELPQHRQDIRFDGGRDFNVGTGSSTGVGVVGFSLNDPGSQSNNNNTLHPEQLDMTIDTDETEQLQDIIRAFDLQQHGQDITFDGGRGFNDGAGSSTRDEVVGFTQNDPGLQSNNDNTLHPEQLDMTIDAVEMEQLQEIIRAFDLRPHGEDIRFDGGRGYNDGAGSSTEFGVVGFSLNDPGPQNSNTTTTLHPEQLDMPNDTIEADQLQEIKRAFDLQPHGQDITFDGGRGFNDGAGSSTGDEVIGCTQNEPGLQSNNDNTLHPEQLDMTFDAVETKQLQEIIRAFDLQPHGQDIRFDGGRGYNHGAGSSTRFGVVGFSLNDPGPQSKNNTTLHPEKHDMPIYTVETEQLQEIIKAFEIQQHEQDSRFDGGRGFNVGSGSSNGVGVVGFSLNDPGPQSNNNNTLHPEQLDMPIDTIEAEQLQEIIRAFDLQQYRQDIRFDGGRGFNDGAGSSTGDEVIGFTSNDPGLQSNNDNTIHPEQLIMPIDTVGTDRLQGIIRAFDLQQHGQDIMFNMGRGFDVGAESSTGDRVVGWSLNYPGSRSNSDNTLHPEQLIMPIDTVGTEQLQGIVRTFDLQQHRLDNLNDMGLGFDVGAGSSTGVGVVGLSQNNPGRQSKNNNNTLHPEQLVKPIATVGSEQQDTVRAYELQQHGQEIRFDGVRGLIIGAGSSSGVGVVGFGLNDPGPQCNNNNNILHPEQLVMPLDTVETEQVQEIIRTFDFQQQGLDIRFDGGQGFNDGEGRSTGVGVVGLSLNDPRNNNNNNLHPEPLVMPIATVDSGQQETIEASVSQQLGQDIRLDGGRGFNVGTGSSTGVGVVGFSLNDPGPKRYINDNTLHPAQLVMPIDTVETEQLQEIIRSFDLLQHGQDIRRDWGRCLNDGAGSSTGDVVVGLSPNNAGPQSNNNTTLHPEQLVMPIGTVGTEQPQGIIRTFDLQQHEQDIMLDIVRGFDVGAGSSTGVEVVGLSLNDPDPQSNNNNNTLHPEQLVMPIATLGIEQQEIVRSFELQQHWQDIGFDMGGGFDVGAGSSTGVGVVGFSLNDPGPQSNNNDNTLHPEQLVMPIATVGSEHQDTLTAFELQQHGQDIRFDGGRGFNVGTGSSTGFGVVGFSLNNPPSPLQATLDPMMGCFESGFIHPHFQPQLSLQPQQVVAVQEHHTQELESQEEWLQGLNVGNGEAETGSSFYHANR